MGKTDGVICSTVSLVSGGISERISPMRLQVSSLAWRMLVPGAKSMLSSEPPRIVLDRSCEIQASRRCLFAPSLCISWPLFAIDPKFDYCQVLTPKCINKRCHRVVARTITVSTVEQHLTRTYRKLDIARRVDLPNAMNLAVFAQLGARNSG